MKRAAEDDGIEASKRQAGDRICLKLLFPQDEASLIEGQAGSQLQLLESLTGSKMKLSKDGDHYPGTMMRELNIRGSSVEAIVNTVQQVLNQVGGDSGTVRGGEANVELGGARLKVLLPVDAAKALDEASLRTVQNATGIAVQLNPQALPPGDRTDASEQVLSLAGPLQGMHSMLSALAVPLGQLAFETWFAVWANASHCTSGALIQAAPPAIPTASMHDVPGQFHSGGSMGSSAVVPLESRIPGGVASLRGKTLVSGYMTMKFLLSAEEAAFLRRNEKAALEEIKQACGTDFLLVYEGEYYPGTSLQELVVQGTSVEATIAGVIEAFNKIIEGLGQLTVGDQRQDPGTASMKIIIPSKATSIVIGPGGSNVAQFRSQTKMHLHVESTALPLGPPTETSEQVVSLYGPIPSIQIALQMMADILVPFSQEPWYAIWANTSNSGQEVPGLVLFQDGKGKDKGGKGKGKGSLGLGPGGLCLKLLVTSGEASCVLGRGGTVVKEISQSTATRIQTSSRGTYFPGTQLQELRISGTSQDAVLSAIHQIMTQIAQQTGAISGGDHTAQAGSARMKVVVPYQAAANIIGPGGSHIQELQQRSGIYVYVEEHRIPPGNPTELSEQVVALDGTIEGAKIALALIAETVGRFAQEFWFEAWAQNSHCGMEVPGLVLFARDKGKGIGKGFKGKGKFDDWSKGGYGAGGFGVSNNYGCGGGAAIPPGGMQNGGYSAAIPPGGMQNGSYSNGGCCGGSGVVVPPPAGMSGSCSGPPPMALKMLISGEEVSALMQDTTVMQRVQQETGTSGMLSESLFPGTDLKELAVHGPSADSVFKATSAIVNRIAEVMGVLSSGEANVMSGDARLKLVIPKRAAAAVIGPGGQQVRHIKATFGIRVSVDTNSLPCGDPNILEEALCLIGPLNSVGSALEVVVRETANLIHEPWFNAWANYSNAGRQHTPGLVLFEAMRGLVGKGKGKNGEGKSPGAYGQF
eukprot:TRINITY_DN10564_c0_g1_i1.p1 TRINITY_DN10564_c0_g1~~TRINITY_DN10564_c0_g1_i1.p1  ORF type:complete len:979 (-),score=249.30 TRINITY_DN10564_c0_g1_i1:14-2950(-)